MRILVGTVEIGGGLVDWAEGFRKLGHDVTTAIGVPNPLYPSHRYDVDIDRPVAWPAWIRKSRFPLVRLPKGAINVFARRVLLHRLITRHDLFLFLWGGTSLTRGNREFPLLKRLGKRIVSVFAGSDVRHVPSFIEQYQDSSLSSQFVEALGGSRWGLLEPLRATRLAERFSDVILSQPNQSNLAVRPYAHYSLPLRLARYRFSIPAREVPVVVHAPSKPSFKGTDRIVAALDQLRNEGVRFEFKVLHGVPNDEVIATLAGADVVVDQLYSGGYGKLSLEAMASGCALATRSHDVFWPFSANVPIWHIESGNLYVQLRRLLTDKGLRVQLAMEGRAYAERHHDHIEVARRVLELLDQRRIDQYDYYPTQFVRNFHLNNGEVVPPELKKITGEIFQRWGLPEDIDLHDLAGRGLVSLDGLDLSKPIPLWKTRPA